MEYKRENEKYFIKLEKGEEVIKTLTLFCYQNDIKSGIISGIGGANEVTVKFFDIDKKEYVPKDFSAKNFEILSLTGNVSLVEEKPFIHIHAIFGDSEYKIFGGHLSKAVIGITAEIEIRKTEHVLIRKPDSEFGLNYWSL